MQTVQVITWGIQSSDHQCFLWHFQDVKPRRFTRQNKGYIPGSLRKDCLYAYWGRLPQLMKTNVIYFIESSIRVTMLNT